MRWFICLLLTVPLLAAAADVRLYSDADLQTTLQSTFVQAQRERLRQLLELRDWSELERWASAELATAPESPLASESLLQEWLIELRGKTAPASTRALVQSLTAYQALALAPSPEPEHRDRALIAAFDVAASARGTLRAWDLRDNTVRALAALADGKAGAVDLSDAEAWAAALDQAPLSQLETLRLQQPVLPTRAAAVMARRLQDPSLYRALFRNPPDSFVLHAITEAAASLPADEARDALESARANPQLASAAVLALGRLPGTQPSLLACLGNAAQGGSCAQALAQDAVNEPALARIIEGGRDDLSTRRALMALHWMSGPLALGALEEYIADARMPANLRVEVGQWLR